MRDIYPNASNNYNLALGPWHSVPFPNTLPHWILRFSLWSIWNYLYFIWTEAVSYTHVKGTVSSPPFCVLPGFMFRLTWGKFRTIYLRSPCQLLSVRKIPHLVLITYFSVFKNSKEIVYFCYFTTHICSKSKRGERFCYISPQLITYMSLKVTTPPPPLVLMFYENKF